MWLEGIGLKEADIVASSQVCSLHFHSGLHNPPSLSEDTPRITRGQLQPLIATAQSTPVSELSEASPIFTDQNPPETGSSCAEKQPLVVGAEQVLDQHQDSESELEGYIISCLLSESSDMSLSRSATPSSARMSITPSCSCTDLSDQSLSSTINIALVSKLQYLEMENQKLRHIASQRKYFQFSEIAGNDSLVRFLTSFPSHYVYMVFFDFLGPAVDHLNYIGSKSKGKHRRKRKLDPLNQFFMMLMKLRLDFSERYLGLRFGVSTSTVSRYFITWVCFLYKQLGELDWYPATEQVTGTMPLLFRAKYLKTVTIIDCSEWRMETPSDLHLQSSSWSNYKHHNTCKFLVACTSNVAISYISPLYLGSISDPEITRVSGFLEKIKPGVSNMADRGFTI